MTRSTLPKHNHRRTIFEFWFVFKQALSALTLSPSLYGPLAVLFFQSDKPTREKMTLGSAIDSLWSSGGFEFLELDKSAWRDERTCRCDEENDFERVCPRKDDDERGQFRHGLTEEGGKCHNRFSIGLNFFSLWNFSINCINFDGLFYGTFTPLKANYI